MTKGTLPLFAIAALALYAFWPMGEARSEIAPDAIYQGGSCNYDGKDSGVGEKVCVEGKEYECTVEGLIATGNTC